MVICSCKITCLDVCVHVHMCRYCDLWGATVSVWRSDDSPGIELMSSGLVTFTQWATLPVSYMWNFDISPNSCTIFLNISPEWKTRSQDFFYDISHFHKHLYNNHWLFLYYELVTRSIKMAKHAVFPQEAPSSAGRET